MTEELEQLLKNLKLRRILEIYEEQLRAAVTFRQGCVTPADGS
jgi:hypothetical protein